MDAESYFGLKDDLTPGNVDFDKKFVTSAGDGPEEVRFRTKTKYHEKLLVWITISEKGISKPCFIPKKAALTESMFREACVKQRLVLFLEEHHEDGN